MIVEMRAYVLHPGQQGPFLALMEREGIAIERRILGRMLGFYTCEIGTLNQVVHMWGYDGFDDRDRRRARRWARGERAASPTDRGIDRPRPDR